MKDLTLTEIVFKIRESHLRYGIIRQPEKADEEAAQLIQSYCDQEGYSKREFEMAYVFGLFGRNELGFWDGRFEENLKRWETVVKPGIFKFTRPDGKQPESELTRLRSLAEKVVKAYGLYTGPTVLAFEDNSRDALLDQIRKLSDYLKENK